MNTNTLLPGRTPHSRHVVTERKQQFFENAEALAGERNAWIERNHAYYDDDRRYTRFIVPPGSRVLDVGCGTGALLNALKPSFGLGIDLSPAMISRASADFPHLEFRVGDAEDAEFMARIDGSFDYIVLSDTVGMFEDIEQALKLVERLCSSETRVLIAYYSPLWEPVLKLATKVGMRMPQPQPNLISTIDFANILELSDLDQIRLEWRQLVPLHLLGLGGLINRFIAPLPGLRRLCLRNYVVARSTKAAKQTGEISTSIVIPCRNERGNIERSIREMPRFGGHQEIIFVEGNSKDDTYGECLRVQKLFEGQWDIKVLQQEGRGKGDAVRKGFAAAKGDILMILDADLTVPAAALPKFYEAIANGKGEFINGTRLVYPMEKEAMRFLNHIANRMFARIFSYLLNQRFTDTLCGTKVVRRSAYQKIVEGRGYFGNFDPFGDFDLIFGAAKQSLKIVEVPIHYKARSYGETQISRFRDGWLLVRMVMFAFKKLKAV